MNILVLGSGGREHAIVWKLNQSKQVKNIYCIPGNGGISEVAKCENIKITDFEKIYEFVINNKIDFVVVGPEQPSVEGINNFLSSKNVPVFGPRKEQAQLEGSKVFSKLFMQKNGLPTADFVIAENYETGLKLVQQMFKKYPNGIVVKADGLAAGKGAVVCDTLQEAESAITEMMKQKIFGSAGENVVIEKKLKGVEVSVIAFCDGESIIPLTHSQDHKTIFDNDKGPNTGGMGAFSPVPFVNKELEKIIYDEVIKKFVQGIKNDGLGYTGMIYFGLMIENLKSVQSPKAKVNEKIKPYVLEFNCRFGDPETQVILPLLKTDLVEIILACLEKKLSSTKLQFEDKFATCVVLASDGYPGKYDTGKEIFGLEKVKKMNDVIVFHAGTTLNKSQIPNSKSQNFVTSGGRVLGVTGLGKNLKQAIETSYSAVEKINFENKYYRKDIGQKGLLHYK